MPYSSKEMIQLVREGSSSSSSWKYWVTSVFKRYSGISRINKYRIFVKKNLPCRQTGTIIGNETRNGRECRNDHVQQRGGIDCLLDQSLVNLLKESDLLGNRFLCEKNTLEVLIHNPCSFHKENLAAYLLARFYRYPNPFLESPLSMKCLRKWHSPFRIDCSSSPIWV